MAAVCAYVFVLVIFFVFVFFKKAAEISWPQRPLVFVPPSLEEEALQEPPPLSEHTHTPLEVCLSLSLSLSRLLARSLARARCLSLPVCGCSR